MTAGSPACSNCRRPAGCGAIGCAPMAACRRRRSRAAQRHHGRRHPLWGDRRSDRARAGGQPLAGVCDARGQEPRGEERARPSRARGQSAHPGVVRPVSARRSSEGAIDEVKTRTLRDQLGERVAALAGADFSSPLAERSNREDRARPPRRCAKRRRRHWLRPRKRPQPKRWREAELVGEPELARREQRRGRGPVPRGRRGR